MVIWWGSSIKRQWGPKKNVVFSQQLLETNYCWLHWTDGDSELDHELVLGVLLKAATSMDGDGATRPARFVEDLLVICSAK